MADMKLSQLHKLEFLSSEELKDDMASASGRVLVVLVAIVIGIVVLLIMHQWLSAVAVMVSFAAMLLVSPTFAGIIISSTLIEQRNRIGQDWGDRNG